MIKAAKSLSLLRTRSASSRRPPTFDSGLESASIAGEMKHRRHIRLTYTGSTESVVAEMLDDEAPNVCEYIWSRLPIETKAIHGMYSGLEVFAMLDKPEPVPPENMVQLPLP